jgi:hypothetical protein
VSFLYGIFQFSVETEERNCQCDYNVTWRPVRIGRDFWEKNTDVEFRREHLKGRDKGIDGKKI